MRRITAKSIPRLLKQKKPGIPRELEALCLSLEHWKENALAAKCNKDIWGFILGDTCACCFQANTEGFTFGNDCPNESKCPLALHQKCCGGRWEALLWEVFLGKSDSKRIVKSCERMVAYIRKAHISYLEKAKRLYRATRPLPR